MIERFTYGRSEKLKSKKEIQALFQKGNSFFHHPIKVFFFAKAAEEQRGGVLTGVGVSKKYFKKAVQRNRIKRLLREAYRVQKPSMTEVAITHNLILHVFFLYTSAHLISAAEIKEKLAEAVHKLNQRISTINEEIK